MRITSSNMAPSALGKELYKEKKYDEAIKAFSESIESAEYDDLAALHSNRCACYLQLKKFGEAVEDAESCTQLKPTWSKGWGRLGTAKQAQGKYLEAAAAFDKAAEVEETGSGKKQYQNDAARARQLSEQASQYYQSYARTQNAPPRANLQPKFTGVLGRALQTIHILTRFVLIFSGVLYCFTLDPATINTRYMSSVRGLVVSFLVHILRYHGRPYFAMSYLQAIMMDPHARRVFGVIVLFVSTNFIALLPFLYVEAAALCADLVHKLDKGTAALKLLAFAEKIQLVDPNTRLPDPKVAQNAALIEVAAGLTAIIQLVTPRRNFIFLVVYWQYLQTRFTLEKLGDNGGPMVTAFYRLDAAILARISGIPSLFGPYTKLKSMLASQIPDGSAKQQQSKKRCSIM